VEAGLVSHDTYSQTRKDMHGVQETCQKWTCLKQFLKLPHIAVSKVEEAIARMMTV